MMSDPQWGFLEAPVLPGLVGVLALGSMFLCFGAVLFGGWRIRRDAEQGISISVFVIAVLLLCAALASSPVRAATTQYPDQGQAWAACVARAASVSTTPGQYACFQYAANGYRTCQASYTSASACSNPGDARYTWPTAGATCLDRPEQMGWGATAQKVCHQGCTYHLYQDPGTGNHYYSTFKEGDASSGAVCVPSEFPPPVNDADGDGVPDEDDAFPNDPTESADSDGDGIGDNADVAPDDPTNGDDDGQGNESDNSAGGGGTCDAPPSCEGDGIACNTNFQIWKARCAAEGLGGKVTGDPTNCNSGYTCENNAVACAQVAVMRAQLCSGTGDGEPGPGSVTGGGNCETPYVCTNGDPIACASLREQHKLRCDITSNPGDDEWGFEGEPGDYFGVSESSSGGIDGIDADGWLNRGQCPLNTGAISALNLPGNAVDLTCGSLSALGLLILMLGWVHAGMIVGRAMSGSS